jgi:hypothetical protein
LSTYAITSRGMLLPMESICRTLNFPNDSTTRLRLRSDR